MKRLLGVLIFAGAAVGAQPARAQITVHDPANTARNTITSLYQQYLVETERLQHEKLWAMAQRLSAFANLGRYALGNVPRWRPHGGNFLYANGINDGLTFGDPRGAAYLAVSHPVLNARAVLWRLSPTAQRLLASRLAKMSSPAIESASPTIVATIAPGLCRIAELQDCRIAGLQNCRIAELQNWRCWHQGRFSSSFSLLTFHFSTRV